MPRSVEKVWVFEVNTFTPEPNPDKSMMFDPEPDPKLKLFRKKFVFGGKIGEII